MIMKTFSLRKKPEKSPITIKYVLDITQHIQGCSFVNISKSVLMADVVLRRWEASPPKIPRL